MHEVINVYGKTILQAIILVGVMWLVFRGVTDENGNKGISDDRYYKGVGLCRK